MSLQADKLLYGLPDPQRQPIQHARKSLSNRLLSILYDSEFILEFCKVVMNNRFPVLDNLRCGSWYLNPLELNYLGSVYFKSTDGHAGKWDFNLRRANLHLLPIIASFDGCLLVDSTQKGKTFPDSFSKTVPIFCATINLAIQMFVTSQEGWDHPAQKNENWDTLVYVPQNIVPPSERALIQARLPEFSRKLLNAGVMPEICQQIRKPLRPIWVSQRSRLHLGAIDWISYAGDSTRFLENVDFHPIVCLSASDSLKDGQPSILKMTPESQSIPFTYIQGAADDEESWARGLTANVFWRNKNQILASPSSIDVHVRTMIAGIRAAQPEELAPAAKFNFFGQTKLAVGGWRSGRPPECWEHFDFVINCTQHQHESISEPPSGKKYIILNIPEGKRGQHRLGACLARVIDWIKENVNITTNRSPNILCHCAQGMDRSVGIALALLVRFLDDKGNLDFCISSKKSVSKEEVQNCLLFMARYRPLIRPSRATLKRVHEYFIPPPTLS